MPNFYLIFLLAISPLFALPPKPEPYWFKTYSTIPYKEFWSGNLEVKNMQKDLPTVLKAIEKNHGVLSQPLSNFASSITQPSQQISFTISRKGANSLLKSLRRVAKMADPSIRQASAEVPIKEIRSKIDAIIKEKTEHDAERKKIPAAAAAQDEILEHLLLVEDLSHREDLEVLFNLQINQK